MKRVKGFVLNIWEGIMSLKGVRNIPLFIFLYTGYLGLLLSPFLFYILLLCLYGTFGYPCGIGHVCRRHVCRNCAYP